MSRVNPPRTRRIIAVIIALSVIITAIVFYLFTDPAESHFVPKCVFKAVTGYDCPGCGFQRALHAVLTGDIATAWKYNPFLFFMLPVGMAYLIVELSGMRCPKLRRLMFSPLVLISICTVTIAWWIIRNM